MLNSDPGLSIRFIRIYLGRAVEVSNCPGFGDIRAFVFKLRFIVLRRDGLHIPLGAH
jgi:hypothetical protein